MRSATVVAGLGKPLEVQNVIAAALAMPGATAADKQASRRASVAKALGEMGKTDQGLDFLNDTFRESVYRDLVDCYAAMDDLDGLIGCILRLENTADIRLALRTLSGAMLRQGLDGAGGYGAELRGILDRADSLQG